MSNTSLAFQFREKDKLKWRPDVNAVTMARIGIRLSDRYAALHSPHIEVVKVRSVVFGDPYTAIGMYDIFISPLVYTVSVSCSFAHSLLVEDKPVSHSQKPLTCRIRFDE